MQCLMYNNVAKENHSYKGVVEVEPLKRKKNQPSLLVVEPKPSIE